MQVSYKDALGYMEGLIRFGMKLGNDRFSALCAAVGNPQDRYRIVHIAGTKGKGSTTAMTAAILREAGYRTGAYFSPYVYDVRERVQMNGKMISRTHFAEFIGLARPFIEELGKTDLGQTTEFELKTLVGFLEFAARSAQFACIEVGIGGRLDATNIVTPAVTVITNIGLDHTQILGDTHELIAAEKAGIVKAGIPCITATDHRGALSVIRERCNVNAAPLSIVTRGIATTPTGSPSEVRWDVAENGEGSRESALHNGAFSVATETRLYHVPRMALRGVYQRSNAACAVAAAERALQQVGASLDEAAVASALAGTTLPGRLSLFRAANGPLIVLDGAHNDLAARSLAKPLDEIRQAYGIHSTVGVIGMLSGHDPRPVAEALLLGAKAAVVCNAKWKRAVPAQELASAIDGVAKQTLVKPDIHKAVREAYSACGPDDMLLITGSFYTVGEVSPLWLKRMFGAEPLIVNEAPLARERM